MSSTINWEAITCARCGDIVTERKYDKHQASTFCVESRKRVRAKKEGFVWWPYNDDVALNAGVARYVAGTPEPMSKRRWRKGRPEVWVPRWAADLFNNKATGLQSAELTGKLLTSDRFTMVSRVATVGGMWKEIYKWTIFTHYQTTVLYLAKDDEFRGLLTTVVAMGANAEGVMHLVEDTLASMPDDVRAQLINTIAGNDR